jgi:hypothetical protein
MTRAVYANPLDVAPADQLAAGLEPPTPVHLSYFVEEGYLFVVDEDAVWRGLNLQAAVEEIYTLESDSAD